MHSGLIDKEKEWNAATSYDRKVKDDMFTSIDAVVRQNILEKWIKNHVNKDDKPVELNDDDVSMVAESSPKKKLNAMNKKSFFWGVLTGVVLTFVGLFVIGLVNQNSEIQYLEKPVSYENKKETSFRVFQVLGNAALANEISDKEHKWYFGNTVVLLGENFYSDQAVTIKNPQRVGTYSYTNNSGMPMTVPVIKGEME